MDMNELEITLTIIEELIEQGKRIRALEEKVSEMRSRIAALESRVISLPQDDGSVIGYERLKDIPLNPAKVQRRENMNEAHHDANPAGVQPHENPAKAQRHGNMAEAHHDANPAEAQHREYPAGVQRRDKQAAEPSGKRGCKVFNSMDNRFVFVAANLIDLLDDLPDDFLDDLLDDLFEQGEHM